MTSVAAPRITDAPAEHLSAAWQRAAKGDTAAQHAWQTVEGGGWEWAAGGPSVGDDGEWAAVAWRDCGAATLRALGSFVIEVTVGGVGRLAGLSFGPYRDFLVDLSGGERRLRVAVDGRSGIWSFAVDGMRESRNWWDVGITGIDDLLDGELCLKTCDAKHVTFTDLTITPFEPTCQLSVVITCNRFLQRLRVTLRNWCEQVLPEGSHELIVANPGSADGCHEYLATVARSYPHVGVREIAIDPALAMNKGAMINRAVAASHGQWVWLCDADCLFSPGAAAQVLRHLHAARPALYFGERHHLSEAQTDALLAGRLDGLRDFDALFARAEQRWHDCAPWGYTQIMPRSVLARWPYPETINHFAHTDTIFADHCRRRGLAQIAIPGLRCLHLVHPFAWYGTNTFL